MFIWSHCFWFCYLSLKKVCIFLVITQFLIHVPSRLFSVLKYNLTQSSSSQSEVLPKEADLVKWSYFCLAFYLIHTCPPSFPGQFFLFQVHFLFKISHSFSSFPSKPWDHDSPGLQKSFLPFVTLLKMFPYCHSSS